MFQSLFSWILLSEWRGRITNRHVITVSILVFLDLALRVGKVIDCRITEDDVSILVFLDLALRAILPLVPSTFSGFNPCFLGSCSPRHFSVIFSIIHLMFQSLFSWILLSEFTLSVKSLLPLEFQSLFSWILLSEDTKQLLDDLYTGFQSLFSWILLSEEVT